MKSRDALKKEMEFSSMWFCGTAVGPCHSRDNTILFGWAANVQTHLLTILFMICYFTFLPLIISLFRLIGPGRFRILVFRFGISKLKFGSVQGKNLVSNWN